MLQNQRVLGMVVIAAAFGCSMAGRILLVFIVGMASELVLPVLLSYWLP
jgi:hypothetical protein